MAGHNDEVTMYIWFCCPVILPGMYGGIMKPTVTIQYPVPAAFPSIERHFSFATTCITFSLLGCLIIVLSMVRLERSW